MDTLSSIKPSLIFAPGGVDFLNGVLVVHNNILAIGVWHEEFMLEFDWTVEWIGQWVLSIDEEAGDHGRLAWSVVWDDDDVELVGLAAEVTLWKHMPLWESVVVSWIVDLEFFATLEGSHNVLVELLVGGAVVGEIVALLGVALDDVLAGLEGVVEPVDFVEVDAVVLNVDFTSVLVVFWTDEDLDEGLGLLVALNLDLVVEGLVVKTVLAGADLECLVIEFLLVDGDGVAQVGVVVIEESDKTVNLDVLNLNSFEVKLFLLVSSFVVLVLVEVVHDPLVHLPEHRVAEGGLEVFQSGWDNLVLV